MFCRQNLRAVKEGRVAIVDGNQMFARPGPRLVDALEFLVGLLHNRPALIPADFPWTWWDTQKAATSAETEPDSLSAQLKGRAGSTSADSSSQVANGNSSSDTANTQVPNGGSSSVSTSGPSVEFKTAEKSVSTSQGCSDKAGQHAAEQSGAASQNSDSVKSRQQAAEQSGSMSQNGSGGKASQQAEQRAAGQAGSTPQDGDSSTAGQHVAERKWGAALYLGPEIEEAHTAAIDAGQPTYTDPATGYKVVLGCSIAHKWLTCYPACSMLKLAAAIVLYPLKRTKKIRDIKSIEQALFYIAKPSTKKMTRRFQSINNKIMRWSDEGLAGLLLRRHQQNLMCCHVFSVSRAHAAVVLHARMHQDMMQPVHYCL